MRTPAVASSFALGLLPPHRSICATLLLGRSSSCRRDRFVKLIAHRSLSSVSVRARWEDIFTLELSNRETSPWETSYVSSVRATNSCRPSEERLESFPKVFFSSRYLTNDSAPAAASLTLRRAAFLGPKRDARFAGPVIEIIIAGTVYRITTHTHIRSGT